MPTTLATHTPDSSLMELGERRNDEYRMVRKDGTEFPVEFSLYSWKMNSRSFFATILRDISERKRAENELRHAYEALQRSRDFFENVFNAAGDGMYVTDELGAIVFANKALYAMLGYDNGELEGKPAIDITADIPNMPLDEAMEHEMYNRDYADYFESFFVRKDCSSLAVESRITNVQEGPQSSPAIIVIVRDITARKLAENEIRQARDLEDFDIVIAQPKDSQAAVGFAGLRQQAND